jgi:hypothetical protein
MIKIDDSTALKLLSYSRASMSSQKDSIAHQEAPLVILGVACIVDYGFSTSSRQSGGVTKACVWIFSESSHAFFGACYSPVGEESKAPSILNSTIAQAIEQAKVHPTFEAMRRSAALNIPCTN